MLVDDRRGNCEPAARRRDDLPRSRALLDAAAHHYQHIDLPAGPPRVLAGLAWWALATDHLQDAAVFAADAAEGAGACGDPATQLLAETAMAAVDAIASRSLDRTDVVRATRRSRRIESWDLCP
jgi:hypothetical protein